MLSTSINEKTIKPLMALVVHGVDATSRVEFVTRHDIDNDIIQEGSFVSPDAVINLLKSDSEPTLRYQSPTIIAQSSEHLVWYKKSTISPMWFRIGSKSDNFIVRWPTLLFVANKKKRSLKVFALDSDRYPEKDAPIYHAPLMNIGNDGEVCQGTAKLPDTICSSTIALIESTIYQSNFSHVNHTRTIKIASKANVNNNDHFKFWKSRKSIDKRIPKSKLVPIASLSGLFSKLQ